MTEVQHFQLPRDDWYDSDGRIYKDVIIENLNAIESKLLELQGLDPIEVNLPDFETISYPDVDLTSEDNCIVNLKSFIQIMGIVNYPLELITAGKTIKKLTYWSDEYKPVEIKNITLDDLDDSKPFVVLDTTDKTISALASFTPDDDTVFLGKFINGSIVSAHDKAPFNVNLLQMIADMSNFRSPITFGGGRSNGAGNRYFGERPTRQIGSIRSAAKTPPVRAVFEDKGAK